MIKIFPADMIISQNAQTTGYADLYIGKEHALLPKESGLSTGKSTNSCLFSAS